LQFISECNGEKKLFINLVHVCYTAWMLLYDSVYFRSISISGLGGHIAISQLSVVI